MNVSISNSEFGRRVGLTHSMASRIRSGERKTSTRVLYAIHQEFGIDLELLIKANLEGGPALADLLATVAPRVNTKTDAEAV